jgi:NADH-quinone oxidoreductase subunit N
MIPSYILILHLAAPELIVVVTALIVVAVDFIVGRKAVTHMRFVSAASLGSLGCSCAILLLLSSSAQINLFDGAFLSNPVIHLVQIAILIITILTLLISINSEFTEHVGEFVLVTLLATIGMMLLVATQDLLVLFLSLELFSLSLYILSAFNKQSRISWESALKYFLFGGMSAAFLLFGFSLLYGLSNSTNLVQVAAAIHGKLSPLLVVAIVTSCLGLGFKVAAAPFYFWVPDVYSGAPAPAAAFIASGSKIASFFVFFQLMTIGFAGVAGEASLSHPVRGWAPVLALMAAGSMLLGNVVALRQTSLRRLLAYSAIAHAGYMLLGIIGHTSTSRNALLYYVFTYALATVGTFAIIDTVERTSGTDTIAAITGLSRRSPALAISLAVFLLSLAGIPPLAGFFAKFYVFSSLLGSTPQLSNLVWLIALALATSAVSLVYYLRVLKAAFVTPSDAVAIRISTFSCTLIVLLAVAVVLLGSFPNIILAPLNSATATLLN